MDRNNTSFPLTMFNYLKEDPKLEPYELSDEKILDKPGTLLYHQKLVMQYMLSTVLIRGILLYFEMGSGKTRVPVALINTILMTGRKFVFIGPKGLHDNLRTEYEKVTGNKLPEKKVQFISLNASNMFEQVTRLGKNDAVEINIDAKEDDLTFAQDERTKDITEKSEGLSGLMALDDTFVFVDEAHKLFNAITNGSSNALNLYDLIMGASNIKVMFATGTIMVNTPFELCPCFNMLAGKKIFPEDREEFEELFIGEKTYKNPKTGEITVIDRYIKNANVFKNRMVGLVSYFGKYVQDPQTKAGIKPEQLPMELIKVPMSNNQFARYALYSDKEKQEQTFAAKRSGRFAASKSVSSYRVKTRMASVAIPIDDNDSSINTPEKLAINLKNPDNCPKYYAVKKYIEETKKGIVMVYCDFVHGVGLERMGKFLEIVMGYSKWTPDSEIDIAESRYIIISGDISTEERTEMQTVVNSKDNIWGDIIKVILIGPAGALGLDFMGIQLEILTNPSFNMAQTDQVIARGVRNYSHTHLPKEYQKVRVIMLIATEPLITDDKKDKKNSKYNKKDKKEKKDSKKKVVIIKKSVKGAAFKDYILDYQPDIESHISIAPYDKFETVESSHYSSTMPWHILQVHDIIKKRIPDIDKFKNIIDATANIGVDSIHFAANTNANIISVELNKEEYDALTNNIKTFEYSERITPIHDDIYNVIKTIIDPVDLIYIDPPWGGSDYKQFDDDSLMLKLDNKPIYDIVKIITAKNIAKFIILKVPSNFAITKFTKNISPNLDMTVDDVEHEKSKKKGFKIITLTQSTKNIKTGGSDSFNIQTTDEYLYEYSQKNKILNLKATRYVIEAAFDCQLHKLRLKDKKQAAKINCLMCTPTNIPLFHEDYKIDISSKYDPCNPPNKREVKAREIILGDKKYMYSKDNDSGEYSFFEYREDLDGFIILKKDNPIWSQLYESAIKAKKIKGGSNPIQIDF